MKKQFRAWALKMLDKYFKEEDYEGAVFAIDLPEGGELKDAVLKYFTGFASSGDYGETKEIRFYAKVVGFEDKRAPMRTWGMGLNKLRSLRGKGGLN